MKEIGGYNITEKEFKRLEELNNLTPIVKYLTRESDILNAFFINFE